MPALPRQQIMLVLGLLGALTLALFIIYLLFFRTQMVPAYQNIRQSDASAIVAELDKAGISYRLENDGHDVLVPEDRASEARVAIAGSNVAVGGTVGFELFDNSDMGLTEFAQKINFQRAMQGELARTIMSMQGVEYARVHLALPERSVFRANQGEPTAAVSVQMMRGRALGAGRVEGIQQLVASSIPGMSLAAVSVLDDKGDLVSAAPAAQGGYGAPLDERSALAQYYEVKAADAIRDAAPDTRFDVTVNARRPVQTGSGEPADGDRGLPARAALILDVQIRTAQTLPGEVEERIGAAVADTLMLDRQRGDALRFTTGRVGLAFRNASAAMSPPPAAAPDAREDAPPTAGESWTSGWRPWALLVTFLVILALALRPRRNLDDDQAASFAEQLKAMASERGAADAE